MINDRRLGTSIPDAVRIELNRLNRALVRETNQKICDEIEAKIQAIEAEYYTKPKSARKPRTEKPAATQQLTTPAKKPLTKPRTETAKQQPAKAPAKPRTGKSVTKQQPEKSPVKKRKKHEPLRDHPLIRLGAD